MSKPLRNLITFAITILYNIIFHFLKSVEITDAKLRKNKHKEKKKVKLFLYIPFFMYFCNVTKIREEASETT
jgi:hypothetical protein